MTCCNLLTAETGDRLLCRRMASLLMATREEAGTLPTALKGGVKLVELWWRTRHLPAMEFGDGGVHRGTVRRRVMWRQWNAEALLVVIAQRAGNECLNRSEAQREWRALPRPWFTHGENWEWRGDDREAIDFGGRFTGERELFKLLSTEIERLGNKSADLPRTDAATASLCSGQCQAFACPGECDIGEATLLA